MDLTSSEIETLNNNQETMKRYRINFTAASLILEGTLPQLAQAWQCLASDTMGVPIGTIPVLPTCPGLEYLDAQVQNLSPDNPTATGPGFVLAVLPPPSLVACPPTEPTEANPFAGQLPPLPAMAEGEQGAAHLRKLVLDADAKPTGIDVLDAEHAEARKGRDAGCSALADESQHPQASTRDAGADPFTISPEKL